MRSLNRRRKGRFRALLIVAAVGVVGGLYWLWDHRHYWLTHNFRVVDPGKVYAGGYQYPGPLRRIVSEYGIKTVLSLRYDDGGKADRMERKTLNQLGVRFLRVEIPFNRPMREQLAALNECLRILTNPKLQPVFVHCWGGQHRTGIVVGAYRARVQALPEEQIWAEFDRYGGNTADPPYAQQLLRAFLRREQRRKARRQKENVAVKAAPKTLRHKGNVDLPPAAKNTARAPANQAAARNR